jgi:hypothetical protein
MQGKQGTLRQAFRLSPSAMRASLTARPHFGYALLPRARGTDRLDPARPPEGKAMRLLRTVGSAAVIGVAAIAFLGTAGASGSLLHIAYCSVDQLPCAAGNIVTHTHQIGVAIKWRFGIFPTLTCDGLTLADVLSAGGLAHLWLVTTSRGTYQSCENEKESACEVKELGGPAVNETMMTSSEEAEVIGEGEVLISCPGMLHCVYNGEGLKGTAFGALAKGPNGETSFEEVTLNRVSGFLCPATAKLSALLTSLSAVYLKN